MLAGQGLYTLSVKDVAHILGLENLLADRPFFATLPVARQGDADAADPALTVPAERKLRWLAQWEIINSAVLGIELSATIQRSMSEVESRGDLNP